jgi:hypothetical protein
MRRPESSRERSRAWLKESFTPSSRQYWIVVMRPLLA